MEAPNGTCEAIVYFNDVDKLPQRPVAKRWPMLVSVRTAKPGTMFRKSPPQLEVSRTKCRKQFDSVNVGMCYESLSVSISGLRLVADRELPRMVLATGEDRCGNGRYQKDGVVHAHVCVKLADEVCYKLRVKMKLTSRHRRQGSHTHRSRREA